MFFCLVSKNNIQQLSKDMSCQKPEELTRNTWYIVFHKGTKKVAGEIVFTSYLKDTDSIRVNYAIPYRFEKICVEGRLPNASNYDFKRAAELRYPRGHVQAKSPFYMKSWDALL